MGRSSFCVKDHTNQLLRATIEPQITLGVGLDYKRTVVPSDQIQGKMFRFMEIGEDNEQAGD